MSTTAVEIYDPPGHEGDDYILHLRVKNGPLLRAIRIRGYKSISQFARENKLLVQQVYRYLALTMAPIDKRSGKWNQTALDMAHALRLPPDSLFPPQHLEHALAKSSGELSVSREEVALLLDTGPHDEDHDRLLGVIEKMLGCLTPREEKVMRLRYGYEDGQEHIFPDIGKQIGGVCAYRALQIHNKAIRKLKHKARTL